MYVLYLKYYTRENKLLKHFPEKINKTNIRNSFIIGNKYIIIIINFYKNNFKILYNNNLKCPFISKITSKWFSENHARK